MQLQLPRKHGQLWAWLCFGFASGVHVTEQHRAPLSIWSVNLGDVCLLFSQHWYKDRIIYFWKLNKSNTCTTWTMTLYIFSRNPYRIWSLISKVSTLGGPSSFLLPIFIHISVRFTLAVAVYQLLCRDLDFKAVLPPCPLQSQGRFSPLSLPPSHLLFLVLCIVILKNCRSKVPTDWLFNLTTLAKLASNTGISLYSVVFYINAKHKKSTAWFLGVFVGWNVDFFRRKL